MIKIILNLTLFKFINMFPSPRLRAQALRLCGARIGRNVRIHKCTFINHELGLRNLDISDGVYIGADCLIDLAGSVYIGKNSTISARAILISHQDPGNSQGNKIARIYRPSRAGVHIGSECWIGVGSILLEKTFIEDMCVIAAGSVVTTRLASGYMYAGSPAVAKKKLPLTDDIEPSVTTASI